MIMHNIIVEDERDGSIYDQGFDFQGENVEPEQLPPATFQQFVQFHREMRDWKTHVQLEIDFVEHMWTHIGNHSIYRFIFYGNKFRLGFKTI